MNEKKPRNKTFVTKLNLKNNDDFIYDNKNEQNSNRSTNSNNLKTNFILLNKEENNKNNNNQNLNFGESNIYLDKSEKKKDKEIIYNLTDILSDNEKMKLIYEYYKYSYPNDKKLFSNENLKIFLFTKLNKGQSLHCDILKRNNKFYLYSHLSEHFILSAFPIKFKLRKNYVISLLYDNDNNLDNSNIIAQFHGDLLRKNFILFDNGISPKSKEYKNNKEDENLRKYLMEIKFDLFKQFNRGKIYIPKSQYKNNKFFNKNIDKNDKLSKIYDDSINIYETEIPEYNKMNNKYYQKFSNRVKMSSSTNFKIIENIIEENQNNLISNKINSKKKRVILESGKINDKSYTMDFQYPLSPLEAFGICLSFLI